LLGVTALSWEALMRIGLMFSNGQSRVVVEQGGGIRALRDGPSDPLTFLLDGHSRNVTDWLGEEVDPSQATFLPPIPHPGKIICVGLNYADHAAESPYDKPEYPVYFLRVDTSLIGHGAPLLRPRISDHFDFEGEMVAVIGKAGRAIPMGQALDHVVAYSIFNDGSIRDYQFKGPQWTLGKNFDGTGAFGPFLVSSDEVPRGGEGLSIQTRLNGEVVQNANTRDLLFPVAELIARVSEAMTLLPGDIVVTGTPAGVGFARKPPLFMKHGDVCEVEVEGIGLLRNPVRDEAAA
jgi:2-keto-4-pentenoate hydratase/2-oxohepta-3-ene-1,7-dioic acid hydratase in catechol pathway